MLSQEEVRKNRFVGGYALETSVEDEAIIDLDKDEGNGAGV